VLAGIDAAAAAGLSPLKINMVVKAGMSEDSIVPMARHFKGSGHIVRFIEYMDVGATNGWRMDDVVSAAQIVRLIGAEFPLAPADANYSGEVAQRWQYQDGSGEIGVVASVTQAFCRDCTRARLSTEGKLYTCLFATHGHDVRDLVRNGFSDAQVANAIAAVWGKRADRYSELRTANTVRLPKVEMSYIGG
jgi:GTP 3',8-cyclase